MRFVMTSLIAVLMALGVEVAAQNGASYNAALCGAAPAPCAGQTGTAACTCLNNFNTSLGCNGASVSVECSNVSDAWNCGCEV
jgi:hypothetical protein